MEIVIVAAMTRQRVIGKANSMPWHLPADLAHFKDITYGKPIIMGRKTFESIGRALPGRLNIVISHQPQLQLSGCTVVNSLDAALACANAANEVMIIGGGTLYAQALDIASRMELTLIDADVDGDTHFPEWEAHLWTEVSRTHRPADQHNAYDCDFVTLVRHPGT